MKICVMNSYQLFILVKNKIRVQIGKLGLFNFPAGLYIYTGSAKRNIEARIARHLVKKKKNHWHVDFLLANPQVKITDYKIYLENECNLNQRTDGTILIQRFGASDCKNNCGSHLKFIGGVEK